jgi:Survival motor neuron (SMN) interacting protein 1 (SIP1)
VWVDCTGVILFRSCRHFTSFFPSIEIEQPMSSSSSSSWVPPPSSSALPPTAATPANSASYKRNCSSNSESGEIRNDTTTKTTTTSSGEHMGRKRPRSLPPAGLRDATATTPATANAAAAAAAAAAAVSLDDVQSMKADEYVALVARQARALPDVFVAASAAASNTSQGGSASNALDDSTCNVENGESGNSHEPQRSEVGDGAVPHREAALSGAKRQRINSKNRSSANRAAVIDGCAASILHMLGGNQHQHQSSAATRRTEESLVAPTVAHLPANPLAWAARTLHQFSTLREYLERLQACRVAAALTGGGSAAARGQGEHHTLELPMNRIPVPAMKDRDGWCLFCLGADAARVPDPDHYQLDDEDDGQRSDTRDRPTKSAWRHQLPPRGYAPDVALLLQLDQVMTRAVLSHLAESDAKGSSSSSRVGAGASLCAWMYALLARLEKPLHRNDASTLYQLLKRLARERHGMVVRLIDDDHDDDHDANIGGGGGGHQQRVALSRLNVLIAVVGIYFEQGGYQAVMTTTRTAASTGAAAGDAP